MATEELGAPVSPPWALVAAVVTGGALLAYLAVWGPRYGFGSPRLPGLGPGLGGRPQSLWADLHPKPAPLHLPALRPVSSSPSLTWASFTVTQWLLWLASVAVATAAVVSCSGTEASPGGGSSGSVWPGSAC